MTAPAPSVAVIIPTRDRRASVERALRALSAQSHLPRVIEVIVVVDGCTDGTPGIGSTDLPFALRVIEQARQGPAAARNRGAAATAADLLIFLDDDVEAWPEFVAAHVQCHGDGDAARVAIGYLPPDLQGRRDFFAVILRSWWEAMFDRMRDPGHRFSYRDLLSGNFSIRRSMFRQAGGFDETLQCHEDFELGVRLIGAGAQLVFAARAAGWHHEHTDLRRTLRRKRDEGRADVALARRHPAITPALPLCRTRPLTRRARVLRDLALTWPRAGDRLESQWRRLLAWFEAAHLRTRWRLLLDDLLFYWYWRGVGESTGGGSIVELCRPGSTASATAYDLDLRQGLAAACTELDTVMPDALRLCWGSLEIGTLPPQPGAEPLRGRHLPSLLRGPFRRRFAETLARAGQSDATPAPVPAPATAVDPAVGQSARGL